MSSLKQNLRPARRGKSQAYFQETTLDLNIIGFPACFKKEVEEAPSSLFKCFKKFQNKIQTSGRLTIWLKLCSYNFINFPSVILPLVMKFRLILLAILATLSPIQSGTVSLEPGIQSLNSPQFPSETTVDPKIAATDIRLALPPAAQASSPVPEAASATLVAVCGFLLMLRRRSGRA